MDEKNRELSKLVKNFGIISNATIAIFDADRKIIASYPGPGGPFCSCIRTCPKIDALCRSCDFSGFSKSISEKKPYLYHCHMGLVEISAPILFGETLLGYILIGQFTDSPDKAPLAAAVRHAAMQYGFSAEKALAKAEQVIYLSPEFTAALTQLMEMCANYIWLNHIICLKDCDLAYEIRLYITEHLTENLSVDFLCKTFGLSRTTLYQIFKKAYGNGITQVIREERIKKAKQLLLGDQACIGEIAAQAGIPDANYFTRVFKEETGLSPTQYRKQKKKETL